MSDVNANAQANERLGNTRVRQRYRNGSYSYFNEHW